MSGELTRDVTATAPEHTTVGTPAQALSTLGQAMLADGAGAAVSAYVAFGELTIVAQASRIAELLTTLRDNANYRFIQLIDLCGADYPERERRFDVVYHLLSLKLNARVRIKVMTDEDTPVPSVVDVFPNADWYEREAFDMYGIFFSGHPDLRRILTDYGFHGHPLRKDFPMTGYVEVRYDEALKRVVYEPVKLAQEYRSFDFLSPWEGDPTNKAGTGYHHVLPGDEKGDTPDAKALAGEGVVIGVVAALALEASAMPAPNTAAFAAACLAAAQKSQAMRSGDRADTEAQRTDDLAAAHWSERLVAQQAEPRARAGEMKSAKAELDDALAQIDGYYSGVRLVNLHQAECQHARRTGTDG